MDNPHPLERLRLSPDVLKIRIGDAATAVADVEEAIVPVHQWESLKEYGVGHREDRGINPDPECQRYHGHSRETGILDQSPKT